MCGRYTITITLEELMTRFWIDQSAPPFHQPRYNVAPGQMMLAIINDGERNRLGEIKWGLVPQWAKEEKIGYKMINARAETLLERPAFKLPFQRKRCIIPADSFYEWKQEGNTKQPMRIMLKTEQPFAMAGLYDTWIAPDGRKVSTCTVITTKPNSLVAPIHDRMPVILPRDGEQIWLDRSNQDLDLLQSLLAPYPETEMKAYPVASGVGNVRNAGPECIVDISKQ